MGYRQVVIIATVIMGVFFSGARASEWKKIGESNGIAGYISATDESRFNAIRGVGIVDAPIAVVEGILRDVPGYTGFVYKCRESEFVNAPEFKNTSDSYYTYMVTVMPFPLKDRDMVSLNEYSIDRSTGTVYLHINSVKTNYKITKNKVRIIMMKTEYILVPKGPGRTEVTITTIGEPGGTIPGFVVDLFSRNLGIKTIAGLRKMAKKNQYKQTKSIATATPIGPQ